jgi:hypothetical protein
MLLHSNSTPPTTFFQVCSAVRRRFKDVLPATQQKQQQKLDLQLTVIL